MLWHNDREGTNDVTQEALKALTVKFSHIRFIILSFQQETPSIRTKEEKKIQMGRS